jgi:peptidoglycan hydrolase-like protein with peptidoglycan-binding domain
MRIFGVCVFLAGVALTWFYLHLARSSFDSEFYRHQLRAQLFPKGKASATQANSFEISRYIHSKGNEATEITRAPSDMQVSAVTVAGGSATRSAYQNAGLFTRREIVSFEPKDASSRYELVSEIQKHLKSRGCYWGRVDGSWGAGSKYAMRTFLSRVNAKLPSSDPHYTMLILLQSSGDMTCGGCPEGKKLTPGGSCVTPSQLIEAKSLSSEQPLSKFASSDKLSEKDVRVGGRLQSHGRMSIGGPQPLSPTSVADDAAPQGAAGNLASDRLAEADVSSVSLEKPSRAKSAPARKTRRRQAKKSDPIRRNLMLSLGGVY